MHPKCITPRLLASSVQPIREYRNLAIFPFSDAPGAPYSGQIVQGLASQSFAKFGFNVIEREKLSILLGEQELSMSGLIEESKKLRIGKMVGARAIVVGNVGQYATYQRKTDTTYFPIPNFKTGQSTYVPIQGKQWFREFCFHSLRVIDVETGQLIYSGLGQYEVGLRNPPQQMAELILHDIVATWRVRRKAFKRPKPTGFTSKPGKTSVLQQHFPRRRAKPTGFTSNPAKTSVLHQYFLRRMANVVGWQPLQC